jgi:hypothetical protein
VATINSINVKPRLWRFARFFSTPNFIAFLQVTQG